MLFKSFVKIFLVVAFTIILSYIMYYDKVVDRMFWVKGLEGECEIKCGSQGLELEKVGVRTKTQIFNESLFNESNKWIVCLCSYNNEIRLRPYGEETK